MDLTNDGVWLAKRGRSVWRMWGVYTASMRYLKPTLSLIVAVTLIEDYVLRLWYRRFPVAINCFQFWTPTTPIGGGISLWGRRWRLGVFSNPFLWSGLAVQMLLGLALIYVQPVAGLLGHVALPPVYWAVLLSFAPLLYGLDRIREVLLRRSE
jgi:hypothetical protein